MVKNSMRRTASSNSERAGTLLCLFAIVVATAAAAFAQQEGFSLTGVVVDQNGDPIVAAQVLLYASPTLLAQTTTGPTGEFTFSDLKTNHGLLKVRAPGFAEVEQEWSAGAQALHVILSPLPLKETVVVTATRTDTRLDDTAASVAVVSADELERTAALRLDDALRQVTGFQLFRRAGSRTANPTTQGVSLRGTGASGASRALVLADGIPLNDPFGGWIYWGRVPRESVGQVEVLRGGASHLYGATALSGVVSIISREPDTPFASVELSYGNEQTPSGSFFGSASHGKWTASLGAEISKTDGYVIVDEDERGAIDTPAGSRYSTANLKLERRFGDANSVFVRGEIFGESRTNGTPLQTNRTHLRQLSAGADFATANLGSFTFRAYGGTQLFDQNFTAVSADRNSETLTRVQRVPAQAMGGTFQWSRVVGASHTLVAGLDARDVLGSSDEQAFVQGRPSFFISAGGRERTVGAFVEDFFRVNPRFLVTAGARVDRDRGENAFSPHLSLLYTVSDHVSLTAVFTRAFRPATLNELFRTFRVGDVITLANQNLRAERQTGGEAGARFYLFNQRLDTRVSAFWTEIARPIANVTLNVTPVLITRQRQNLGRTRSRGIEIETEARLSRRWTLSGGYLLADATVLEFPANPALEGLRIPQVPKHQGTFQARYTNPAWVTVGVQARAGSEQFDDDQNRLSLGRYFTIDAFASRPVTRNFDLFIAVENLLNQRYLTGRTPVTTIGPPILVRAGMRFRLRR